jgi:hypothetical protein
MPTSTRSKRAKQARDALTKERTTSASPTKGHIDVENQSLKKRQKQLHDELRGPGAPKKQGEKAKEETDPVGCALDDKLEAAQQRAASAKSYKLADAKMAVQEAFLIAQAAATAQPVRATAIKPKKWRIPRKGVAFASAPTFIDDATTVSPLLLIL